MSDLIIPTPTTRIEIDIAALARNVSIVKHRIGDEVAIISVVKSDGYGLGHSEMARGLVDAGVHSIGVATTGDALSLRRQLPDASIMVIYPVLENELEALIVADVEVTATSLVQVRKIVNIAKEQSRIARIHLQVETGMHHYGAERDQVLEIAELIAMSSELVFAGVSTHFAAASTDQPATRSQFDSFVEVLGLLANQGSYPELIHCANSAALDVFDESWASDIFMKLMPQATVAVRIGSLLYGVYDPKNVALKTEAVAKRLVTHIAEIKQVIAGDAVGYFGSFIATQEMRIAILPIGWGSNGFFPADGVVFIEGNAAPIIGSIGANTTVIDISAYDVGVGALVTIFDETTDDDAMSLRAVGDRQAMFVSRVLLSLGTTSNRTYIGRS